MDTPRVYVHEGVCMRMRRGGLLSHPPPSLTLLRLAGTDLAQLAGKHVLVVEDIIDTGGVCRAWREEHFTPPTTSAEPLRART